MQLSINANVDIDCVSKMYDEYGNDGLHRLIQKYLMSVSDEGFGLLMRVIDKEYAIDPIELENTPEN